MCLRSPSRRSDEECPVAGWIATSIGSLRSRSYSAASSFSASGDRFIARFWPGWGQAQWARGQHRVSLRSRADIARNPTETSALGAAAARRPRLDAARVHRARANGAGDRRHAFHVAQRPSVVSTSRHRDPATPSRTRRRRSTSAKARPPITDQQRQKRSASQRARRERERLERLKRQGVPTHLCVICKRTLPRTDFPPLVTRRFQGTKCLACLREGVKGPVPCSIPDCARPAVTRGWCARHYQRWRETGDPLHGSPVKPKPRRPGRPPAQPRPQIRMTSLADEPPAKLRRLLRAARDINIEFSEVWEASVPIATEGVAMAPMWDTVLSETRGAWESAYDRTGQPPALSRLTRDLA